VTERETTRLIVWSTELRRVHSRLRQAMEAARIAVDDSADQHPTRELLLYCRGFCVALGDHHRGEDRALFPAIEAAQPELGPVLRALARDHSMIGYLLDELSAAVDAAQSRPELERHLDGISAIMESHFAYEERQLLTVLDALALNEDPHRVLGSL
jgi:hypothetical protein